MRGWCFQNRATKSPGARSRRRRREAAKQQAPRRRDAGQARRKLAAAEARVEKFTQLIARVDEALAAPDAFARNPQEAARLASQREELAQALAAAEEQWLEFAAEAEAL